MRLLRLLMCTLPVTALFVGCTAAPDPWAGSSGPKVLAYFPALGSLAMAVAGSDATVQTLLTGKGPHDYEPTAADARRVTNADLFLVNGLGLDDRQAETLVKLGRATKPRLVELGELLPKESLRKGVCAHCKAHGHDHAHDDFDPHVWLGVPEACRFADAIAAELGKLAPDKTDAFAARAAALRSRLEKLQADGTATLAAKGEKPRLLARHDALHYFARSFGVEVVGSVEIAGGETGAKQLAETIALCKEQKVRLIGVEPQYSDKAAVQEIANALKRDGIAVQFVEIDPLETALTVTADLYEQTLRANVERLLAALK